jgi:hypothetical protein
MKIIKSWSFLECVFELVVGVSLVIVVTVKDRIIDEFDLFLIVLKRMLLTLILLSLLAIIHRRRKRPGLILHIILHHPLRKAIIAHPTNSLKILPGAPPIQRITNTLIDLLHFGFLRRKHLIGLSIRVGVDGVGLHLDVLLDLVVLVGLGVDLGG